MDRVNLDEARHRLVELVDAALEGQQVIIGEGDDRLVQLVPVPAPHRERRFGSARGLIKMADDFDAPLPDFDEYGT